MTILDRLLAHDAHSTRVLIERCRPLGAAQLTRRFDIGPGSIHETLRHLVGAMSRWADRIGGEPTRPDLDEDDRVRTLDELLDALDRAAADLGVAARRVDDDGRLDEMMEMTVPGYPEPFRFTRGTAIVHIVTHGAHHRAQVLNMLRQLGETDLPDVDAIEWELAEGAPGS